MFDMGKFGSSFRGGPLNGFDAMVMSEQEKKKNVKPSQDELNAMTYFLIANGYLDIEDQTDLDDYPPEAIQEMYNRYK